jgi:hypothetical protein
MRRDHADDPPDEAPAPPAVTIAAARRQATALVRDYLAELGGERNGHTIGLAERKLIASITSAITRSGR